MRDITIKPGVMHHIDIGAGREYAGVARRFCRNVLYTWNLSRLADDVEQIAGELIANALPGGRYRLILSLDPVTAVLRVEVRDHCAGVPERHDPSERDEHGRGLLIVEALADRWGHLAEGDGNRVWAELQVKRGTE